jgi:hypothetical protein
MKGGETTGLAEQRRMGKRKTRPTGLETPTASCVERGAEGGGSGGDGGGKSTALHEKGIISSLIFPPWILVWSARTNTSRERRSRRRSRRRGRRSSGGAGSAGDGAGGERRRSRGRNEEVGGRFSSGEIRQVFLAK